MVISYIIKFEVGTDTTVSGAAKPLIVVRVTPAVKSLITNSSANKPNWSTATGPEITTSVTRSLHRPRIIVGSSLSCGREVTLSNAVSTSTFALPMSQLGSNSRDIRALPSFDVLLAPLTPSTPSKTGSKTLTMAESTSSAPAPCQTTLIFMLSIMMSGKN